MVRIVATGLFGDRRDQMKRAKWVQLLAFVAVTTCGRDTTEPVQGSVESIVVSPAVSTVSVGASIALEAEVLDVTGIALSDRPVHWASENTEIATVSANGMVTARKVGTVQVAASTGGRSGVAQITVTTIPVASILVTPGNKSLLVEESFQLTAQARDAGGNVLTGRPIAWSSNNEGVATVSASGLVTALSPGGAIITATSEGRSSPASITVTAIPVASIDLQPNTQSLVVGQAAQLQAQPLDDQGNPLVGRMVLFFTNNASVATVTSSGVVTGQAQGTATITATSEGKSATTAVTVNPRTPNAVIITPAQLLVQEGDTAALSVQVLDNLGQPLPNSAVTFSTSDAAVATVSSSGVVTGVLPGKATVSATSGGKTGTAEVTVTATPVATVVVTPAQPSILQGRSVALTAQALNANGQPLTGRTVSWSSSTPTIADVTVSGFVTGVSVGSTVIFASIDGVLGWANVTVVPTPVAAVTVSPATSSVAIGQTVQLTAVTTDASGSTLTGRVVTWSSNLSSVATVTSTGVVTGVSGGTATITATSEGQAGTATVTVGAAGVRTITVTPTSATVSPFGGTVALTAVVRDPSGAIINASVTWSTSNALVATVSSNGTVTGHLPGTATITAKSGSATATATITVK
jgi:uncharacterized protein YjdB